MTETASAHPGGGATRVTPAAAPRHRRALRLMIVVLIPLGVWTIAGLIAFWPHAVSTHIASDVSGYTVAGTTYPTARITKITETSCEGAAGSTPGRNDQICANVAAVLLQGPDQGTSVEVPMTESIYGSGVQVGQEIKLVRLPAVEDQPASYQFSDFERSTPLIVLTVLFALAVVVVARWRGFASLLGLGFAGFILVKFMFPALISGSNPLVVGLVGSSAIMFVVLYAAHGFSTRTTTALVGTLFGLILTAALGYVATRWAHLTGVTSDDDYLLAGAAPDLRLTSVVICGIIVAGLGVLNDVTITQASAVWELAEADPDRKHLFSSAMRIGRDHIASTVYTIAFATAGAALPVLLLIAIYNRPLLQVVQTEQFAGEVIRALVGSIGLVLAVPLTTAIGVAVVRASRADGATSLPTTPQPAAPSAGADEVSSEGRSGVVRRGRRRPTDDLDFSDLRPPADDDTQVRRPR
ncbi:MAG TPA: YibE/F family protein [Propionibacteriaceae bacterium]|nr:YibE/F family protein [Propionibacteriaceae bacterium]